MVHSSSKGFWNRCRIKIILDPAEKAQSASRHFTSAGWVLRQRLLASYFHFPLLLFELYTSITTHVCFHPDFARHLLWARRLISLLVTSAVRTDYREKAITETWGWIRSEACRQKRPFTAAAAAARPAVVSNIIWNCCWTQADGRQGKMYVL